MFRSFPSRRYRRIVMTSTGLDIEKSLYRFIVGGVIGFLLGCHITPNVWGPNSPFLPKVRCAISVDGFMKPRMNIRDIGQEQDKELETGGIYIGMMSTITMMDTRVEAAIHSWMKKPNIKVEVFADNNGSVNNQHNFVESFLKNGVRVIQLAGVSDNVYPPQKKSFSMVKFMHDMYIDKYDWFIRLDDDAYVNIEKLQVFLNAVNSSRPLYLGHAGLGKNKDDYIGDGQNYCMGGTGMLFSKALLRQLAPKLGNCLQNLMTEHEDIELGRCVTNMTGIKCAMSWESQRLFYQNYKSGSYAHNIKEITTKQIDEGLIFHANKDSQYLYNLHVMVLKHKVSRLIDKVSQLEKDLRKNFENGDDRFNLGANSYAQYRWDTIVRSNSYGVYERDPVRKMHPAWKGLLLDNTNAYVRIMQSTKDLKYRKLKAVTLELTYKVVNPLFSVDAISQLGCNYVPSSPAKTALLTLADRRKMRYIHQRQYFPQGLEFFKEANEINLNDFSDQTLFKQTSRQMNSITFTSTPSTTVNFLMALSGRPDNFIRFLRNFESTFLERNDKVNLIVAFFPEDLHQTKGTDEGNVIVDADSLQQRENYDQDSPVAPKPGDDVKFISERMDQTQKEYPGTKLKLVLMEPGTDFSRGIGLQTASNHVTNPDEIVFFCDVDLVFAPEMTTHIRRNTIQGKQVFFPVFFSQYDPDVVYVEQPKPPSHFHFDELDGFWRFFSYGMLAIYKSDFGRTEGFNTKIQGWGLEDIYMVEEIQKIGMDIFKSPEPAQVHVYHDKYCDPSTSPKQFSDCVNSRAAHYGPKTLLYNLWKAPETAIDTVDKTEDD